MGEKGVSFIRRAGGEAFTDWCEELASATPKTPGVTMRIPGLAATYNRPALSLLNGTESAARTALAHIPAKMAVARVLKNVPELLEPQDGPKSMAFDWVRVGRNPSGVQFVKLYARNDSRPPSERHSILNTLSDLAPEVTVDWPRRLPDITIASADPKVPAEIMQGIGETIQSLLALGPIAVDLAAAYPSPRP
jgi:hypothetical protein